VSQALKRPWSPTPGDFLDPQKRQRTFINCFCPTPSGTDVRPVNLVNNARKRTMVVDLEEGLKIPEMKKAMDSEIESFRGMKCIETVEMHAIPGGANLVTTRWVLAVKTRMVPSVTRRD
jgi:hypothetical protein